MSNATPAPSPDPSSGEPAPRALHFIEQIVEADNAARKWGAWDAQNARPTAGCRTVDPTGAADAARLGTQRVHTRFPPEPNGYLHIGHAKSICLNFGLAQRYGGKFNMRFDDTNPAKEEQEYVDSIIRDVRWLGADFDPRTNPTGGGLYYASDYFDRMYDFAIELIRKQKAYVCELSADEVSKRRGTPQIPATSPFRDRPAEESLKLFAEMKAGKHPNGSMTLRARIDLASPNFNLRDPVMYRIVHEHHHNTGDAWSIYPMYDWAHGIEDSLEEITHSICTLEFENHRPLYDWFIDAINEGRTADGSGSRGKAIHHPQQIEFAKFRPTYTVLSKRNLLKMVQDNVVSGWDDPRMPTISGLRRRGFTPEAIRQLMEDVGVSKVESMIDLGRVEGAVRDHLNKVAPRAMAVLRPLKLVIENWPDDPATGKPKVDELDFVINPELLEHGGGSAKRKVPFSKVLYIERDDFMENPPKKFFRLAPGNEVRLRWAYIVKCTGVEKDAAGNITEVRCTYDPATRGGDIPLGPDGKPIRKVQGTIHWVSAQHAIPAEVRLFDRLFKAEEPGKASGNYMDDLNPQSLEVVQALLDPHLAEVARYHPDRREGDRFQFERLGYFCIDKDSAPGKLVFNRTVTLKDTWAKESARAS
ncbi:MAG: glutamine--tRNA ligase/YqeY domain fusion protein [Phycisphaerales bacterium]|nr:glutamine--tRNA ligase/YqeY domain fusion protein [Phycisphaerales bacterium]